MSTSLHVVYGGTFDPVHAGHVAIACAARDALDARVHLLPAHDPPHKEATGADACQRAAMLGLAVAGEPRLCVDERELRRAGPSYTVDTLFELRGELGEDTPLAWLVGGDSLLQLHTWSRWRQLFKLAHVVAVQRPGQPADTAPFRRAAPEVAREIDARKLPPPALHQRPAGGFAWLPLDSLRHESSSVIRRRIRAGLAWRDQVPPAVAAFIDRHGLYR